MIGGTMKTFRRLTAIILSAILVFAFSSCSDTAESETVNTLGATAGTLTATEMLSEYKADPEKNSSKIVGFGFTADEFRAKFVDEGEWRTFNLMIQFGNDNDFGVTVFGIDVEENGKKGVYISTAGDAVIGLPSKFTGTQEMYCRVIADSALSETDIIKTLGKMGIQILFANAATGAEELTELEQGELMHCGIDFIL